MIQKSLKAETFISHEEILDTLKYAEENKHNVALIDQILAKARPQYKRRQGSLRGLDASWGISIAGMWSSWQGAGDVRTG